MSGQRPRGKGEVVLNGPCAERIISHFFPQGGQQWWVLWSFSGSLPLCLTLLSILCMLIWANKDACSLPLRGSWQGWNERLYYLLLYLADLSTTPVSTYLLTYLLTYFVIVIVIVPAEIVYERSLMCDRKYYVTLVKKLSRTWVWGGRRGLPESTCRQNALFTRIYML